LVRLQRTSGLTLSFALSRYAAKKFADKPALGTRKFIKMFEEKKVRFFNLPNPHGRRCGGLGQRGTPTHRASLILAQVSPHSTISLNSFETNFEVRG
jgi:hypothetical protein